MAILLVLIPISLLLLGLAIWAFAWAVRRGQFEDLDTPALDILRDDDGPRHAGTPAATAATAATATGVKAALNGDDVAPATASPPTAQSTTAPNAPSDTAPADTARPRQ